MPIRARIALFGGGVVASTLLLFGALLFLLSVVGAIRTQDTTLRDRAEQAAAALQSAPTPDLQPRRELAPINLRHSTDSFVEVLAPDGTPISGSAEIDGKLPAVPAATLARAIPKGFVVLGVDTAQGLRLRAYVRRWSRPELGLVGYYVIAGQPSRFIGNQLRGLVVLLLISALLTMVVALAATWWVSGRSLRPLVTMAATADEIRETTDLGRRLPVIGAHDEIGTVTRSFNAMLGRLQVTGMALDEAYKRVAGALDLQKRFVADASHELRTPLTTIRSNAGFLLSGRHIQPDDQAEALRDIAAEAERMTRLVQDLLTLAGADAGQHLQRSSVGLRDVCESVMRPTRRAHEDRQVQLLCDQEIAVNGNPDALTQLLWILIDNAIKHTRPGGTIELKLRRESSYAVLSVCDDGDGIPPADVDRVFERFFQSSSSRGGGAGLGLSIARWIVEEHGGSITAANNPERGATFTIRLPAE